MMAFLLMLGIQATIIPWTITNIIGWMPRVIFRFKVTVGSKIKEVHLCRKVTYKNRNSFSLSQKC